MPRTSRFKGGIHNAKRVLDASLELVNEADVSRKLYLWVHFFDAHSPHRMVRRKDGTSWPNTAQGKYDSELAHVDRHLGQLIKAIQAREFDSPLIVITSDHGSSFDKRHERPYGHDLHSDILRVPLIFHAPFLEARRVDTLASTMDILPTLANLLRLKHKLPAEGVSLVPELLGRKPESERYLHHQLFFFERRAKNKEALTHASIRDDTLNLMVDRTTGTSELYDWRADPAERTNLIDNPDHEQSRRRLHSTLSRLLAEISPSEK